MASQIKLRRDTSARWTSINPTLGSGEPGLETDTLKIKYGDGATVWTGLQYAAGGTGGAFTGGTINNALVINTTTDASSTTTGALRVFGGVGVGGDMYVGGTLYTAEQYITYSSADNTGYPDGYDAGLQIQNITDSITGITIINSSSQRIFLANSGGIFYLSGASSISSPISVPNTIMTAQTGVGINVRTTTQSTATTNGALIVAGGAGIARDLNVGGVIRTAALGTITTASITQLGLVRIGSGLSVSSTGTISVNGTGGATGNVVGPEGAVVNLTVPRYLGTGTTLTTSSVIIGNSGEIQAPKASSVIPFFYNNSSLFPNPTTYSGAIAYSGSDTKVYIAKPSGWDEIALVSGLGSLPIASNSELGGVKIGTGVNVDIDGTISVTTGSFALQTATNTILGGVKIGSGINITGDGTISAAAQAGLATRSPFTTSTGLAIAVNTASNIQITGYKSYLLMKVGVTTASWVTIYNSDAARTADASRAQGVDPLSSAGVIAEVITAASTTTAITPGVVGWNDLNTTTIFMKVVNISNTSTAINVTLTLLQLEA
jgi:hypothetical protein